MAEAAGLTLGTVALASLFTTCIECIEYFELSKSYEYDYGLACLKLSLLKSRLDNWWYATGLCSNDHEGRPPSTGWPRKRDVIQTSLQGFYPASLERSMAVFGEALKNRQQVSFLIAGLVPRIRALASHSCDVPLRGRYDKQRFDGLINDLEFLISNIEAASPREPPLTITPLEMDSRTLTVEHKAEVKCRSTESSSTAPLDSMANQSVCKTSIATMAQRQPPQQTIIQASASTSVKAPSNTCIHREQGYTWSINEMRDSSAVFYGNVGGAQLAPAPAGQTVQFKVGTTTGHARVMGGAMNDRNFDTFFNATARDRK